ncbi:EamA family transporter [Nonomuraea muscovyensis]|uniref:Drug/metabolite transporter (DMT)-like permease n=1 Tax=Nonomuraea muscovyensis TaxID=1124761 RepID=A0A7X0C0Y3_9ACTN|nr:EamA family transporter [Nonomuraea muscovyensis]MBB6346497.1 drug/metabolite transporter (DMT)-like permease [Nonomuraea muscovyensis]MDF2707948.1 EamA family transporter [Nonomuraea muscovyensis]
MHQNTADRRSSLLVWGALAVVYVVWGSTYLGIAVAVESIPPLLSGAMRFVVAGLLLGGFLLARGGVAAFRMTRRQFFGAAVVGLLLLTFGNGMVAVSEQYISTGLAALLVASVPLWLVVFRIMVRDRPKLLTLAGVLVGFAGVAALSLSGAQAGSTFGIVVILFGSLSWSVGSFMSSRIAMPANPFAASTVEMLVGGVGLTVLGTGVGERVDLAAITGRSWTALAYLVVVGSLIGFTAFSWLLGHAPISLISTYAYVNPVVAVVLGALVLNEQVTGQILVGGLVILVGVALVISIERGGSPRSGEDPGKPGDGKPGDESAEADRVAPRDDPSHVSGGRPPRP